MKLFAVLGLSLFVLSACASAGSTSECAYRSLIGKNVYNADLSTIRSAGKEVRILYPDSYLGFERNLNRVNVIRDHNDEIVGVTCG